MEELVVAEKIGELVLGTAINKLGEYRSKKDWSKLFVNTGELFLKEVESGERIIEDISTFLSNIYARCQSILEELLGSCYNKVSRPNGR